MSTRVDARDEDGDGEHSPCPGTGAGRPGGRAAGRPGGRRWHDDHMPHLLPDPAYFATLPKVITSGAVILRDEHDRLVI